MANKEKNKHRVSFFQGHGQNSLQHPFQKNNVQEMTLLGQVQNEILMPLDTTILRSIIEPSRREMMSLVVHRNHGGLKTYLFYYSHCFKHQHSTRCTKLFSHSYTLLPPLIEGVSLIAEWINVSLHSFSSMIKTHDCLHF